jgi:hypothetical protein
VIVNLGETRADLFANVKLSASTSNLLEAILND